MNILGTLAHACHRLLYAHMLIIELTCLVISLDISNRHDSSIIYGKQKPKGREEEMVKFIFVFLICFQFSFESSISKNSSV